MHLLCLIMNNINANIVNMCLNLHSFDCFCISLLWWCGQCSKTSLFIMISLPPPVSPTPASRDSLESKVTFIQLSEWASSLQRLYSSGNSPENSPNSAENNMQIALCWGTGASPCGSCVSATGRMRHEPKYADQFYFFFSLSLCFWLDRRLFVKLLTFLASCR